MGNFSKVSDILHDMATGNSENEDDRYVKKFHKSPFILDDKTMSKCVKKTVAFGFWQNICGSRFSKFSIPYDIKGNTLLVAVKNPQVMQELIFCKSILLPKIQDYFLPLDIHIEDIRYDYKSWNYVSKPSEFKGDDSMCEYEDFELDEVEFTLDEMEEISKLTDVVSNLSFLDPSQKERYSKNIINSIKANKLRKREEIDRQRK